MYKLFVLLPVLVAQGPLLGMVVCVVLIAIVQTNKHEVNSQPTDLKSQINFVIDLN